MTARQDVTLPKGQAYTFSAFFQTLADTVAQLRVTYKNSDGDEVAVDSLPQCSKGEWERMSVSFSPKNRFSSHTWYKNVRSMQ